MSLTDEISLPRWTMILFFVIETSGGMAGVKISAVNEAMEETISKIKELWGDNPDIQIKISVLGFSTGAKWISQPTDVDNYEWQTLDADGVVDLGEACHELNKKLSRRETGFFSSSFFSSSDRIFAPIILLVSLREPTDNYYRGLEELKINPYFKNGLKAAIAINSDVEDITSEFTGSKDAIILVKSQESLRKSIPFLALKAIQASLDNSRIDCNRQIIYNEQIKSFQDEDETWL
jgi:uncharacterized protein YegL